MISLGHLAGREEASLIRGIEDRPHQALAARVELGSRLGETGVKSGGRTLSLAAIGTVKRIPLKTATIPAQDRAGRFGDQVRLNLALGLTELTLGYEPATYPIMNGCRLTANQEKTN